MTREDAMQPLLRVENLGISFNIHHTDLAVVRGVSFDIRPGATVALVGESGSGKSVTAQAVMGILPDIARIIGGRILLAGGEGEGGGEDGGATDIAALPPGGKEMRRIRGGRISMIFQEPMVSLSPLHTVGDQVSEALFLHRQVERAEGMRLTAEMLAMVGFPDPQRALKTYPFELSGGLRQRAMIAMALVCRPALLIADEPTTALDVTIQAQILKLIKDLQEQLHMAVLIITHDLGVVANIAEEVVVMYQGEVMESGEIGAIFNRPQHPYLRALLRAVPHFEMKPGERLTPIREVKHQLGALLSGREPWPRAGDSAQPNSEPHLIVRNLGRAFTIRKGGFGKNAAARVVRAVEDVSFTVMQGESFGLVGESGCGKTTLSKLLMRALLPDRGEVVYNDRGTMRNVHQLDGAGLLQLRQKMQFVFQDPFSSLNPRMTVLDIIREPLVIHRRGDGAQQVALVKELMKMVGLDPRFLNRYPHSFSGGQRQRIGIARALALRPDFLICDEPVSALDVSIQAQILNLLKDLQQELGLTYLFISHNLAVVNYIAGRIAVMCGGRLVEVAERTALFRDPRHPYTRALLSAVPFADLERPLDFAAIAGGQASTPADWPAPFTVDADSATALVDVGGGHWVRMAAECPVAEAA
ncbi:MAG: ABC transporter ATP-binding protein [Gammaproteobacteria bacterium]|nr:ABC transporter ATP-binding protein [Gammaproteobacteria bacterium]